MCPDVPLLPSFQSREHWPPSLISSSFSRWYLLQHGHEDNHSVYRYSAFPPPDGRLVCPVSGPSLGPLGPNQDALPHGLWEDPPYGVDGPDCVTIEHKQGVLTLPWWSGLGGPPSSWYDAVVRTLLMIIGEDLLTADGVDTRIRGHGRNLPCWDFFSPFLRPPLLSAQELWSYGHKLLPIKMLYDFVWIVLLVCISVSPPLWVGERAESMCSHFGCPQSTDLTKFMLSFKRQDLNLSSKRKIPTKVFLVNHGRFQRIISRFVYLW